MSLHKYLENHVKNDENASKKAFSTYLKEKIADHFIENVLQEDSHAFDVYLNGKLIDTVFDQSKDARDVKKSLIDHDGYDDNIAVKKCLKKDHKKDNRHKKIKEDVDFFPNKIDVDNLDAKPSGQDQPGSPKTDYFPNKVNVGKIKYKTADKSTGSKTEYFPNKVGVDNLSDGKGGSNEGGSSSTKYFLHPVDVPEYSFEDTVCNIIKHFDEYNSKASELYSKGASANDWNAFLSKVAVDHHLKYEDKDLDNLSNKIYQNKDLPDTTEPSSMKDWNRTALKSVPSLFSGVRR